MHLNPDFFVSSAYISNSKLANIEFQTFIMRDAYIALTSWEGKIYLE